MGEEDRSGTRDERPGASALDAAKAQAADLASQAARQGRQMAADRKDRAADQVDGVAQALRKTADELDSRHVGASRYVGMAADRLQNLGQRLRDKDIDGLIEDAHAMGRRSPGVLFAGSLAVGFLLARFFRASGQRRSQVGVAGPEWQDTGPAAYERMPDDARRATAPDVSAPAWGYTTAALESGGAARSATGATQYDIGGSHGQI